MRILVFSDIHGNAVALEAMLADVKGESFDHLVCLGDAIQGGPQPHEVAVRLHELGCPVVMGNADDFLLSGEESGAEQISDERRRQLATVRDWSFSQLTQTDREMIGSFSPTGGHTHVQFMRHFGRTFHFNPGSVGLAYRHDQEEANFHIDSWAEYAILTVSQGRLSLEFRRVPFDTVYLMKVYEESGRPFAEEAIRQYSGDR